MRLLLILWLMFALPVQAVLALDSAHCPGSSALGVPQHHQARSAQPELGVATAAQHCATQGAPKAQINHCSYCVLCPALGAIPAMAARFNAGFKTPQMAALAQAHSSRHGDVPEKPPKSSSWI